MQIRPFKALRFDPDVVGQVANCIAPPYDVIDVEQQQQLYARSPYNIVRITKGKAAVQDGPSDNVYTRASALFSNWLQRQVLRADTAEAIYPYIQDFKVGGKKFRRIGFVALGRLEQLGGCIRPHEDTLAAPKADRLNLIRATAAQFGQILMLYDDGCNTAEQIINGVLEQAPLIDFLDEEGTQHRLFVISLPQDIQAICEMMADKDVLIADGHHRYETALTYYNETRRPAAQFGMMTFVNMRSKGLVILPTHRLVGGLEDFGIRELVERLKENFDVDAYGFRGLEQRCPAMERMFGYIRNEFCRGRKAFGFYGGDGAFYSAVLKDINSMESLNRHSPAWQHLDVAVLHTLILERVLGITEQQLRAGTHIEYVKGMDKPVKEAIARVESGQKQVVFFVNPTRLEQVRAVAAVGEKMPQKATFFYPKVFTGLTVYKL